MIKSLSSSVSDDSPEARVIISRKRFLHNITGKDLKKFDENSSPIEGRLTIDIECQIKNSLIDKFMKVVTPNKTFNVTLEVPPVKFIYRNYILTRLVVRNGNQFMLTFNSSDNARREIYIHRLEYLVDENKIVRCE